MSKVRIIDPHLHLFDLQHGEYHWLKPENPPLWPDKHVIRKTNSDKYLQKQSSFELAAYVHIEAGFDNQSGEREIANIEARASLPHRSVGFIDITLDPEVFMIQLRTQAQHKSTIGVRHIFEDTELPEKSTVITLLENINSFINLTLLAKHNGVFELQFDMNNPELVVQVFTFFQRIPNLQLVINHAGFAPTAYELRKTEDSDRLSSAFMDWKANTQLLARLPRIAVKCSGFEMMARDYSVEHIQAVISHCIDAFGYENVMLASNFPLCELSLSYEAYWLQLFSIVESLTSNGNCLPEHKKALYYDNAYRIYQFDRIS
ncbi:amidohydrolase family protein [Glaciecola sp. MF2-115]|uniref:amidohydrolase family protein n=1 Tax=Glaciecola sp. MF2-115 TaxID=3384827 RepID=UPI0039A3832D